MFGGKITLGSDPSFILSGLTLSARAWSNCNESKHENVDCFTFDKAASRDGLFVGGFYYRLRVRFAG